MPLEMCKYKAEYNTMECVYVQNKIKMLFEKIMQPNFIMDNYYAESLINKLDKCGQDPKIFYLERVPLISDLLVDALDKIANVHSTVKVFVVRLLATQAYRELHFTKIFYKKKSLLVEAFSKINTPALCQSLKVAYMEVAISILEHNSGALWLLETGVWKEILSINPDKQTVFVLRNIYKFAAKFLWKLNDLGDEESIKAVLELILKPMLQDNDFIHIENMTSEQDEAISKTLVPMAEMLLAVVSTDQRIEEYSILMNILFRDFNINFHLGICFDSMLNNEIKLHLVKLLFYVMIAKVFLNKPITTGQAYTMEDFMLVTAMYFNAIQRLIRRRNAKMIIDFSASCTLTWVNIWKSKNVEQMGTCSKFEFRLIILGLVPTLVFVNRFSKNDDTLKEYLMKLHSCTCEHTIRSAYALRDLTLELDTLSITLQSIKSLSCINSHLSNEQANVVFQALFYILKQYDPTCDEDSKMHELFENDQDKVLVMTYVLDAVLTLVKSHNINWHESLEVLCLYTTVYNILKRPNLSCKFTVTALNVITVTIRKFIPPNLSLLLDSKPGSSMHELGKLIYMKMHDLNWEVRDSALELLLVCTNIAFVKFPPFRNQIVENKLISVATTMALNDHEYYVQVTALKCIGAASKINCVWDSLKMDYSNILENIIYILRNSQEGIVRKEACNVIADMYQNLKLPSDVRQTIYDHMVSSTLADFHWEVQLNGLKFWKIVIQVVLMEQGMLDGTFPPVTFSKETRKIVNLNPAEIQRRLLKALDELTMMGCLTVLVKTLTMDAEVEILESALAISTELMDILNKYKVPDLLTPKTDEPATAEELMCEIKEENPETPEFFQEPLENDHAKSDNVIEGILNSDDVNLLASIYDSHMNISANDVTAHPRIKLIKWASAYLFVSVLKRQDIRAVIDEKKRWKEGIKSLPSLLDDVLGIYEATEDVNSLDCY